MNRNTTITAKPAHASSGNSLSNMTATKAAVIVIQKFFAFALKPEIRDMMPCTMLR